MQNFEFSNSERIQREGRKKTKRREKSKDEKKSHHHLVLATRIGWKEKTVEANTAHNFLKQSNRKKKTFNSSEFKTRRDYQIYKTTEEALRGSSDRRQGHHFTSIEETLNENFGVLNQIDHFFIRFVFLFCRPMTDYRPIWTS